MNWNSQSATPAPAFNPYAGGNDRAPDVPNLAQNAATTDQDAQDKKVTAAAVPTTAPAAERQPGQIDPATAEKYQPAPAAVQAATPKKTFTPDPAGVAIAQQLKMDSNAIKLFQRNQGLTPDGQIGPRTTAALKAAQLKQGNVAANDKGGARGGAAFAATDPRRTDAAGGGQGGAAGYEKVSPLARPISQGAVPATTGGYPDRITDPEGYKKEIDRRLFKKFGGGGQPAANNATPATTKEPIYRGSESGKNYVNPDTQRESSEVARIRHLAGLNK
jgi:hypothetical protein